MSLFSKKKTIEELVEDFDTSTSSTTKSVLKGIIEQKREEAADYRAVELPKDFEDGEQKGWWTK